MKENTKL